MISGDHGSMAAGTVDSSPTEATSVEATSVEDRPVEDTSVEDTLVASQVVEVEGIPMSALVAEARRPRAVIVALHGGAATSRYFDCPNQPALSLLRTGAALGFTVIALDRPGYGSSSAHGDELTSVARRVELAYAAMDRLLAGRPQGAGVFLLAHSIGCELAVRMAVEERATDLLGLELAGTGRQHSPTALEIIEWQRSPSRPKTRAGLRSLLWQPVHLYPAEVVGGASIGARSPSYEGLVARRWAPYDFPELAARVRVPVHFSLGDHELVWQAGPSGLAEVAAMFTAASRVVVEEQVNGGHNLSLGLTARAYHLKVLSFVEECMVEAAHRQSRR
jgi:pimeloyl-ACP methyl ester carboxylesterase